MYSPKTLKVTFENKILAALSREDYEHIAVRAEPVRVAAGKVLCQSGEQLRHAYFLRGGMVSLLSVMENGATVEVGMIGSEGVVGGSVMLGMDVMPYQLTVQLSGNALRLGINTLREEFSRGGRLQTLMLRYLHTVLTQVSQSAACNRFHTLEERLSRWLLVSRDCARTDTFNLTQEFISQMIGAPRTRVTIVASNLQKEGLIRYSRGKIQIIDGRGLESSACECYRIVSEQISHFIAA
jgi:CRP-like cAMP-binding protein